MTARDPFIHGRKTIAGLDLTFGETTTAPCGKRRPVSRTSADPDRVTCPRCRTWAAGEERELAQSALAAAQIAQDNPGLMPQFTPAQLTATANDHETRAARWDWPAAPEGKQEK